MVTLQTTTTSNWPAIASAAVAEVEAIIGEYAFVGNWEDLTVAVRESEDGDPHLVLYGYAAFEAVRQAVDEPIKLRETQRTHLDAQSRNDASEP